MRFLDLFSGIGGFRLGMEQANSRHECVGWVEQDVHARRSYEEMYDTAGEWTANDITKVQDAEIRKLRRHNIDLICAGFPCQPFSVAGKQRGLADLRGTLVFHVARFAQQIQPRFLLLENVKGILSHDKGQTFAVILNVLDDLGYDVEWQVLNSKDFGVPQSRERVFIIGHLRGSSAPKIFPLNGTCYQVVRKREEHRDAVCAVITPNRLIKRQNGRRFKNNGEPSFTLTAQDRHGVMFGVYPNCRMRLLTPRECWRLQGFPDILFYKARAVNSDAQLYKQAGNSVTVNVITAIAKEFG